MTTEPSYGPFSPVRVRGRPTFPYLTPPQPYLTAKTLPYLVLPQPYLNRQMRRPDLTAHPRFPEAKKLTCHVAEGEVLYLSQPRTCPIWQP